METEASRYQAPIDLDNENDSHVLMIRLVGGGKRVLDVGCWNGDMAFHFAQRNVEVVGIEVDEAAAQVAATRINRVLVGDVEKLDLTHELGAASFDVVVLGDVLEHLKDPTELLRRIHPLLAPGGYIVASIPNVAHGSVRLNLLRGEFRYTDVGLLDRTHLRFFTRETVHELFDEAGYAIVEVRATTVDPLQAPEAPIQPTQSDAAVVERVQADPDAHVYQFVVRAVPDDSNNAIRELYRRERQLSDELTQLRRTAAGRAHGRATGVVQVAVIGAAEDGSGSWCLSLLQREIERRWPEASVVALPAAEWSAIHLRWADGVVLLGHDEVPDTVSADLVAPVDLTCARLAGMVGVSSSDSPLFGLALHASRARKDDGGPQRLAILRLLGSVPPVGGYLVVAVDPGAVEDLEGFGAVLGRIVNPDKGLVLLPLSGQSDLRVQEAAAAAGLEPRTLARGAPLEEVIAVLGEASGVITTDPCIAGMALSLGLPHALLAVDGAPVTLLAAVGGGVAGNVAAIEGALYGTADLATSAAKVAPVQARVDDVLDAAVATLALAPIRGGSVDDPEYVRSLEETLGVLQRRLLDERVKMASAFEKVESEWQHDMSRHRTSWRDFNERFEALELAADSYRAAMADLQERLYVATRPAPAPPPPTTPAGKRRRIFRGVVRRIRLLTR